MLTGTRPCVGFMANHRWCGSAINFIGHRSGGKEEASVRRLLALCGRPAPLVMSPGTSVDNAVMAGARRRDRFQAQHTQQGSGGGTPIDSRSGREQEATCLHMLSALLTQLSLLSQPAAAACFFLPCATRN